MNKKRIFISDQLQSKISIWKSNHPEATLQDLSKKFHVKIHQARYALQKHAEKSELLKNTSKGQLNAAQMMRDENDDLGLMKSQLSLCAGMLEMNPKMKLNSRVSILYKMSRIRQFLQSVELEAHMNRADAEIIARIIRRYAPGATNDDVIKIYNEEIAKIKMEKKR